MRKIKIEQFNDDNMEKVTFNILVFLFVLVALAQSFCHSNTRYFEGEILYDVTMKDHISNLGVEQLKQMIGAQHTYLFSKGRYKSKAKGSVTMNQIYVGGDSLFNEVLGSKTIMWHDVGHYDDEIVDFRIERDVEEVNGILCSMLFIESKKGSMKYYFNKEYGIDVKSFENHHNNFWNFCAEKTQALPVKWITDTEDYYIELTATKIMAKEINDDEYLIPNLPREELK